jgi:hypothetical protein
MEDNSSDCTVRETFRVRCLNLISLKVWARVFRSVPIALGHPAEATMTVTKPDLRAVPDTCGVWHVQGCTGQGLEWLANEVPGQPDQTVVVLDEYVAELADKARDAGLIVILLDGPPLQAA